MFGFHVKALNSLSNKVLAINSIQVLFTKVLTYHSYTHYADGKTVLNQNFHLILKR